MTPNQPLKLSSRRVERTYRGGKLLDEWQGAENPRDGDTPELWVASTITAFNPHRRDGEPEGLAYLREAADERTTLKSLVESDPTGFLGEEHCRKFGAAPGVLTKILDTSERLIIQVHPDRTAAKRLFNSSYGKTEAWYIMACRRIGDEDPYVLLGFKPGMTREKWKRLFEEQDVSGMENALHKIFVKPGEVIILEGGMPHAIGPGCLILEIQEPTDITLRMERQSSSGLKVADILCHQGLGFDRIFDCFHYTDYTDREIRAKCLPDSKVLRNARECTELDLIGEEYSRYFGLRKMIVSGEADLPAPGSFYALVALKGAGGLSWLGGRMKIRQGEQLFVPAGVRGLRCSGEALELALCLPPK